MASLVGSRVERKEDKRFLTGKGRYTSDINLANQTHAIFVRSPHARAQIKKLDISKASKASGVVSILTGNEIAEDKIQVPELKESAVYKLRKHVEQVDDISEDDEDIGDDFENLYKGEIFKKWYSNFTI